jgi:hypothetical protein
MMSGIGKSKREPIGQRGDTCQTQDPIRTNPNSV